MVGRCTVPECNNTGRYLLPKNKDRRCLWMKAMRLDGQILKVKYPSVCTLHFKESDFNDSDINPVSMKRRSLKRHAVPSIFPWNEPLTKKQCEFISPEEISNLSNSESEMENDESQNPLSESLDDNPSEKQSSKTPSTLPDSNDNYDSDVNYESTQERFGANNYINGSVIDIANTIEITEHIEVKQEENSSDESENPSSLTKSCGSCGSFPFFSVHSYKNEPNGVHFYTGLENFDKLMFVYHSLGNCMNNLNYFYGPPPDHLDTLEQFCLTLLILRRHREFEDIAMLYKTSQKQVTNIFITWIRFMALQWRNIDLWVDRDVISDYMPLDFKDKYPNTRVIIDTIECPIKRPRLPTLQQITFSSYKNRNTIKLLIGIAPSGLITYISPCYGGSATDRQIIERSSILDKFQCNDEIMVGKGLNVQDIFLSYGVKVNMPTFLGNQINSNTLTRDRKIASKGVHVERVIRMLKSYKILTQAMNQTETLLSSDITFIIAMLVNFRSGIINRNA